MELGRYLAQIITCILSAATLLVTVPAANADVTNSQSDSYIPCAVPSVDKDLENLLWKIVDAGEYFGFEGKRLTVALSEEQLKSDYGFSDAEYTFLVNNVLNPAVSVQDTESYPTTFTSCSGVYISYVDFTVGFADALLRLPRSVRLFCGIHRSCVSDQWSSWCNIGWRRRSPGHRILRRTCR